MNKLVPISDLIGETLQNVVVQRSWRGEEIVFTAHGSKIYTMTHEPDCIEDVTVEDICGDLEDLVGSPIVRAEKVSQKGNVSADLDLPCHADVSYTWTFYKIDTLKGGVTIRWFGTSNGHYSEEVSLYQSDSRTKS